MQVLGHDETSRLIGSGLLDPPPVRPSRGQSSVLQATDHSVAGSMTTQPPGFRSSALRVTAHDQQVTPLRGGLTPLQRCNRCILQRQQTRRLSSVFREQNLLAFKHNLTMILYNIKHLLKPTYKIVPFR